MSGLLSAAFLPYTLSASLMVALAAWLLWLDPGRAANRVFAALLVVRAGSIFLGLLRAGAAADAWAFNVYNNLSPYTVIPLLPLALYFVTVYPRRRGLGRWRWGGLATASFIAAALAWYAFDHAAYASVAPGGGSVFSAAGNGYHFTGFGPLILFSGLRLPAFAVAGLVLAWDYVRSPQGSARNSLFLVAAALTLNALYDGTKFVLDVVVDADQLAGYTWWPWGWVLVVLPASTLLPAAAAVAVVAWHAVGHPDAGPRRVGAMFVAAATLPPASALFLALTGDTESAWTLMVRDYTLGLWRLLVPLMVTYALLRYGLFDVNVRLKAGLRRGIIVALFTLTFFVVFETAEALVAGDRGVLFGIVAAGLLALANRPVERFGQRAADALMPSVKPLPQLRLAEKQRLYLDQLDLVRQDQAVSAKERRMLQRLASALGFTDEEVAALERGDTMFVDEAPVVVPGTRQSASAMARGLVVAAAAAVTFGVLSQGLEFLVPISNFQAGLFTAAIISLLLGRVEALAGHLTRGDQSLAAGQETALADALREAWSDGVLSARDRQFLGHLETELGILPGQRRRIERRVRRELRL